MKELNWQPKYDLISGLKDSFENDFIASGREKAEVDISFDGFAVACFVVKILKFIVIKQNNACFVVLPGVDKQFL